MTESNRERTDVDDARDALLDRHPKLPAKGSMSTQTLDREIVRVIATGDNQADWRASAIRDEPPIRTADVTDALTVYAFYLRLLVADERNLIEMARRRGVSWDEIARRLKLENGAAAQRRHEQLVSERAGWLRASFLDPDRAPEAGA
jgi:hypothetical protein